MSTSMVSIALYVAAKVSGLSPLVSAELTGLPASINASTTSVFGNFSVNPRTKIIKLLYWSKIGQYSAQVVIHLDQF